MKAFILILLTLSPSIYSQEVNKTSSSRISSNPCEDTLLVELEHKFLIAKDSMTIQEKRLLSFLETECEEYKKKQIEDKFGMEENAYSYDKAGNTNDSWFLVSIILALASIATLIYLLSQ
jgi:hypothetical protein